MRNFCKLCIARSCFTGNCPAVHACLRASASIPFTACLHYCIFGATAMKRMANDIIRINPDRMILQYKVNVTHQAISFDMMIYKSAHCFIKDCIHFTILFKSLIYDQKDDIKRCILGGLTDGQQKYIEFYVLEFCDCC
jgi:hypothetical protein